MKNYFFLSVGLACTIIGGSCNMIGWPGKVLHGTGNIVVNNPAVSSFNAIEISVPMKTTITVQPGAAPSIQISGYENVLGHIKIKVEDNTLVVFDDLKRFWRLDDNEDLTARITVPSLVGLSLAGSPDADVHGIIASDSFSIDISGSSTISIDSINVTDFYASIAGDGDLTIKGGTVKYASYEVSGQANINAFPLQTSETSFSIAGQGDGEITASEKLTASISGQADIRYKGHPSITQDIAGQGNVKDAN